MFADLSASLLFFFNCISLTEYLKHCRSHRHINNVFSLCGHKYCGRRFSSYSCFAVHMSRTHNFCNREYADVKRLVTHLSGHIQEGLSVTCPFGNCAKAFNVKTSFSSHISRCHRGWTVTQIAPAHICEVGQPLLGEGAHVTENVTENTDVADAAQSIDVENDNIQDAYTTNLALFLLRLQAKCLVPASTITGIANEMKTLQDIQQEYTMDVLSQQLEQYGVPAETFRCLKQTVYKQSPMYETLNENGSLSTHHRRLQYYKAHYNYVDPMEVKLGYNDNGQKRHYHHIPVLESLTALLKEGNAVQQSFNSVSAADGAICDITDGHVIKSNAMFSSDPDSLKVMLFQDSFEVPNPLGSAKRKHKIVAVSLTLGKVCTHHRSAIDQIQLVLLCLEEDCKYFGMDQVFSKLVSDLCELEVKGISFEGKLYMGTVACIMEDNLGSHMIGGFTENFSSCEYFCRYCPVTKDDFRSNSLTVAMHRDPVGYNESLNFLESHPDVTMHHGIKGNSVFNRLSNFHVCQPGLPPCLAHEQHRKVLLTMT